MAERAFARNRDLVMAKHIDVSISGVEKLPYPDNSFDKVMSVHAVYFWEDLATAFGEIARATKARGILVLIFRTDANAQAVQSFPSEIYNLRSRAEVERTLTRAGFSIEKSVGDNAADGTPAMLVARKREDSGGGGNAA